MEHMEAMQQQENGGVPVEKVKSQVKKMAEQCQKKNLASVTNIENSKDMNIRKCLRKMEEISHTEAHLDKMLDGNLYLDCFYNIRNEYERDMKRTAGELITDINNNYSHMATHMRSMFQDIGGYADGIGNEKFYREYEMRKEEVENRMIGEVRTEDFGSGAITEFACKTKDGVRKIVKKLYSQKVFLACLPILLLLVIFFGTAVIKYQQTEVSGTAMEENKEDGTDLSENVEKVKEATSQAVLIAFAYTVVGMFAAWGSVLVFLALILFVLYAVYIRWLKKWYFRCVCRDCGEYLRTELDRFAQERAMYEKARQAMEYIAEEYERQYLTVWNRIFMGTKYEDKEAEEVSETEILQKE